MPQKIGVGSLYESLLGKLILTPLIGVAYLLPALCAAQSTLYVDADHAEGTDTWNGAIPDLQLALRRARAGDEIWVAAGIYYPTANEDRDASFQMIDGVALYGGFTGDETSLEQRDWIKNPTVLSGDIGERGVQSDNSMSVSKGQTMRLSMVS